LTYSFSPQLNKSKETPRQRLDMKSEFTKAKIEQERIRLAAKEVEECTFKPNINKSPLKQSITVTPLKITSP
jgi:hypothetical protein